MCRRTEAELHEISTQVTKRIPYIDFATTIAKSRVKQLTALNELVSEWIATGSRSSEDKILSMMSNNHLVEKSAYGVEFDGGWSWGGRSVYDFVNRGEFRESASTMRLGDELRKRFAAAIENTKKDIHVLQEEIRELEGARARIAVEISFKLRPFKIPFESISSYSSIKEQIDEIGNSLQTKLFKGTSLELSSKGLLGEGCISRDDFDNLKQEGFEVLICETCVALLERTHKESSPDDWDDDDERRSYGDEEDVVDDYGGPENR